MSNNVPLLYLDTGEMLAISGRWLDQDRALLVAIPEVNVLLPAIQSAHDTLIAARPASGRSNPRLEAVSEAQRRVDLRHDHALRATYYAHEALAEHLLSLDPPDTAGAQAVNASQAQLFPEGLGGTRLTYRAEIGNAQRAEELAAHNPAIRAVLGQMHVTAAMDGLALISQLGATGKALDQLERERQQVGDARKADATPRERAARNGWISLVNAVLAVLDHSQGPLETVAQVRRSVVEPAQKAAQRAAGKKTDEPSPVPPSPPNA